MVTATHTAETITAVATVAAVVIALGIAVTPPIWRWFRRPVLDVEVSDVEPHLLPLRVDPREILLDHALLRAAVRNTGSRTATRVGVVLLRRWRQPLGSEADEDPTWELVEEEPIPLRWSNASKRHVALTTGFAEFVELVAYNTNDLGDSIEIRAFDESSVITGVRVSPAMGLHRWEIATYGDEIEPVSHVIEFVINGDDFIDKTRIAGPPPAAGPRNGLFRSLRALRDASGHDQPG